jgi:RNA polymerase sigma-70 factor (ECF subfamily)
MTDVEFTKIVSINKDRVFSFACYFLQSREEAEDITQEAFVRLWKNAERINASSIRAWLLRVTHNLCVDRARRRGFERSKFFTFESKDHHPDSDCDPGVEFDRAELQQKVLEAMQELPQHLQSAIILREIQGLSYQEISDALDAPLNTIKANIHRARHALRKSLAPFFDMTSGAGL